MVSTGSTAEGALDPARPHGADSEVGRLRTVMLHRPGLELKRLTPRNNDKLLFDGIPWVSRAQDEHDAFAAALRERDVEVLYLTDLLTETFAERGGPARRDHQGAGQPAPGRHDARATSPVSCTTRRPTSSRRTSPRASATTRSAAASGW